jgi:spore maturation protein CgeB
VPDGRWIGEFVTERATGLTAFYDIDTPITLANLQRDECTYLSCSLIARYQLYLSFTGGPTLKLLETQFHSPKARAFYCSVDPGLYYVDNCRKKWVLGYLGTYSQDRQSSLNDLLLEPARALPNERFIVAGPQYPRGIRWPKNVERVNHLNPSHHRTFYNQQRFTLNITRTDMKRAGYSPSVRLFEAAACGTAIISDAWPGLETFFESGREILLAHSTEDTLRIFSEISDEECATIGRRARKRILARHTSAHRAAELEAYILEARDAVASSRSRADPAWDSRHETASHLSSAPGRLYARDFTAITKAQNRSIRKGIVL